ncbi:hypothetical protein [Goodfellowiella coeruleoviolacea]|uniref:Uncharacterized protein n=1 Tax=Goodfellowiella coeruleoviolacea TaxID=334858 RepID=A0AAE3KNY9_9PSEU|nr:hypothetical protein [Goodfellowiella coeruleoviolacea]MCP2169238.1 hypothetical protein [Goodfellowiella coeruleoviolacea]
MTRAQSVRFLRTASTMAFPEGRLLAVRRGRCYVLAPDGWTPLGTGTPAETSPLTRAEAEDWVERQGYAWERFERFPDDAAGQARDDRIGGWDE